MIIPVPAIDLLDGSCVRLMQGAYDQVTHYHSNPLQVAQMWESLGAPMIHIVDLDAARSGGSVNNFNVLATIANQVSIPIQTGGGIRSKDDVTRLLEKGIHRVIIGTAAVTNHELVGEMIMNYGEDHVAVGIDAKEGEVRVSGWMDGTGLSAVEFAKEIERYGVRRIIYTDINRDGTMQGPNLDAYKSMGEQLTSVRLMVSGGVSGPADLEALNELVPFGVDSVIIGRALYEKKFTEYQLWNPTMTTCL